MVVTAENASKLERPMVRTGEETFLTERGFVTAVDVLVGLGWLEPRRVDEWRQGRVDNLERVVVASLGKVSTAMRCFRGWDQLAFLVSGDVALTSRAKANSGVTAVVVPVIRSRGRYERQGILVEQDALECAEEACLADEDARARRRERDAQRRAQEDLGLQARMAQEIARLFPG
jgi:hypothetical protein